MSGMFRTVLAREQRELEHISKGSEHRQDCRRKAEAAENAHAAGYRSCVAHFFPAMVEARAVSLPHAANRSRPRRGPGFLPKRLIETARDVPERERSARAVARARRGAFPSRGDIVRARLWVTTVSHLALKLLGK